MRELGEMNNGKRTNAGNTQGADLVELSVVLVATSNNPAIINPDFLKHNGILEEDRELKEDPVATPMVSQVAYESDGTR